MTHKHITNVMNRFSNGAVFWCTKVVSSFTPNPKYLRHTYLQMPGQKIYPQNYRRTRKVATVLDVFETSNKCRLPFNGIPFLVNLVCHDSSPDPQQMSADDQSAITDRVVEWLQDSIVTIDLNGVITSWNRAAQELYSYTAHEAIGKSLSMLTLPEDVAQLVLNIEKIRTGGVVQLYDTFRIHKEGREIHLEIRLSPLKNKQGKVIGVVTLARDVSEVRAIQSKLAQSEARLSTLSDVIIQLVWEHDIDGRPINFNKRWFNYSGFTWEESIGYGWKALLHPEDAQTSRTWEYALRGKKIFETEVRLRRHDGEYRWHLLKNVPYNDPEGRHIGWFGSATEIHDLHEARSASEKHAEKLRAVLDAAVDFAVVILDDSGIITDWNSGAELMFGHTREEVLGKYTDIIFTEEDRTGGIPELELVNAREAGRSLDERWHMRKDGSRFFMSGVMVPIRHSSTGGYVKIARNITDRKLTEEALFLSEQRRNIVQSAEIGEWDWDIKRNTTQLSEQTCVIFGIAPCKFITGSPLLDLVHPEDLPQVKATLDTALKGLNIFTSECRILRADNKSLRWVNVYGRVVAHENNEPVRIIGVVYDVTNRKLLESHKDDFINLASHELKTPMTTIKVYSSILEEALEETAHPENVEIVKKLNVQVDRLVSLINSLLDVSNLEGKMKLNPETFDLNELVTEQIGALQLTLPSHQLVWEPGNISLVHADRKRIGQVITNFITNAVKYSPGADKVVVTTEDKMDGAVLKVQDFGMGLSPEQQGQVFERYYRGDNEIISNIPGLGVGLYISAEIIRQHSGAIWVESIQGEGASFYFKLPYS